MTMCFQSRAATVGRQGFAACFGVLGTVSGESGRAPPKAGSIGGAIETGGGIIGECVQPTKISPHRSAAASTRLDLDFLTRTSCRRRSDPENKNPRIPQGNCETAAGVGLYR